MIALTSAMALAAAAPVAAAQSGTYVVESCRAGGQPAPMTAWTVEYSGASPGTGIADRCGDDGVAEFNAAAADGALGLIWTFKAPGRSSVVALDLWRFARSGGSGAPVNYSVATDARVLEQSPASDTWEFGDRAFRDEGALRAAGLQARSVSIRYRCATQTLNCLGDEAWLMLAKSRVTVRDSVAPAIDGALAGSIVSGTSLDGMADLRVGFVDDGGGVKSATLRVDGDDWSVRQLGDERCSVPYVSQTPCPVDGEVVLRLDTDRLSNGRHRVEAVLADVAGNRSVVGPFVISVRAPDPAPIPAEPFKATPLARGDLIVEGRRTVRARYDKPPLIRGTLKTPDGTPIGAARVGVTGTSGVLTDAQGRFRVRLPKGPSRSVTFSYGDAVQTVKVIVAAPIRLKVSPTTTRNGRSVKFSGSVPQAGKARTRVELQAWANGQWVPFRTVPLRNGRFSARYRFMRTFFEQRYRFRAVIQSDPDFPYAAGRSKEVRVLVRP